MNGKRLEILREISSPICSHVALIANPEHPGERLERAVLPRRWPGRLIWSEPLRSSRRVTAPWTATAAFDSIARDRPVAFASSPMGSLVQNLRGGIIEFATRQRTSGGLWLAVFLP